MNYSLYDILFLDRNCTDEELKRRYYELTRAYNPASRTGCYEKYLEVVRAYNFLKDNHRRNYYNIFGDVGLSCITDPRKEYIITRILDSTNIKLLITFSVLLIMNISILPLSLYLHASKKITFFMIFLPLIMAHVLFAVFLVRSIFNCRNYELEGLSNFKFSIAMYVMINFLFLSQILIMCYVMDFKIDCFRYLWTTPYIIVEIITLVRYIIENSNKINCYFKLAYTRIPRIICMHLFIFPIDMSYKVFIPLLILMFEMIIWRLPMKVIFFTGFVFLCFLSCFYICLKSPYEWLSYTIGLIYIIFGMAGLYVLRRTVLNNISDINICKNLMLVHEI